MAKEQLDTVYKIVDVVGVSEKSWEDAGRNARPSLDGGTCFLQRDEIFDHDGGADIEADTDVDTEFEAHIDGGGPKDGLSAAPAGLVS